MTGNPFYKAVRSQAKLRLGLDGPSGSGKTYTALVAATALANGARIAVIDTERGSASLYSDKFTFDVACLTGDFNPKKYIDLIKAAEEAGYAVIVIDSLSHAWEGEGGVLDLHDQAVKRQKTENSFTAWKDVTPVHRALVDAMLQSSCHIIATMRSKTEYVIETIERNGRQTQQPKKIGMAPIQRQGMEYEFTIVGDLDVDHNLVISKSRMEALADKAVNKPDQKFFRQVLDWLNNGATPVQHPENSVQQPAFTPDPQQSAPKNNGQQPPDEVDVLGQKIWLDKWPACKAKVLKAKKDPMIFAQGRDKQIKFPNGLADHVKIVWPRMEALVPGLLADASKPSPYEVIRACRHAWAVKAAKPALTTEQLLAVALSELAIPAEFA